ncbi:MULTISPECIES: 2-hydroxyacid dehydrogenase family protein [Bacillus cereus group]|uniref:Hydroxyacid dehydrogenase n=1 Tax=Bacillus pseudomycoides TaxID=64104 RepID=A0AAJ2DKW5_9BACI|nr:MULTISPECIES: 2-hydroxyacid dehydrogenase family protein [Bacillus cereus group]EEM06379.1 2-hydroxyacid dehydrogenase [Bacillus pseudomycoides]EEM12165.1 2-hydroxyacid dehydrogenase [Bacillus pseudomycoides]KFN14909.1 S-adenosyl-L-homocysteine hydrolase, NAD binding domain protein [Bacillus pseudomycoides]MBD5798308.1 hydroxyacid dehydrogenase [Bacillus pseudomycoides]MBJ8027627.1 2-hydroxyacid dehydrogenase family protein [Bacillus cereus group sp. N21]
MAKILVAGNIPEIGLQLLQNHEIEMYDKEELISTEELAKRVKDKDALLSLLSTKVTKEVIDAASNLKIIANYGAGYDNIAYKYAAEKGVVVTNTPKVSTEATAELTFAILLAAARRIPEGDTLCRTVGFNGWAPLFFLGREVYGKTIGIIGLGEIGKAVAKRAKAFGMNVIYTGPNRKYETESEIEATYVTLEELLQTADFITINCAYNPSLHHMINEEQFKMMKKTAYIINAARGPIMNELALAHALETNEIEGAALDVFEFEPKITERLKGLKNVVLTPHVGNATFETRDAMAEMAVRNILAVLEGEEPLTPVNQKEFVTK